MIVLGIISFFLAILSGCMLYTIITTHPFNYEYNRIKNNKYGYVSDYDLSWLIEEKRKEVRTEFYSSRDPITRLARKNLRGKKHLCDFLFWDEKY